MKQQTTIVIETLEPVTPEYITQRVAEACSAYGALRPGESVTLHDPDHVARNLPKVKYVVAEQESEAPFLPPAPAGGHYKG